MHAPPQQSQLKTLKTKGESSLPLLLGRLLGLLLLPLLLLLVEPVHALALNLVHEVEVALVEVVDAHVAVLAAGAVALARRVGGHGVERAEVAAHAAHLLLEDLVVEARLELALARRRARHVHGGLAAAEDHEVLLHRDGGAVHGRVGGVGLEDFEVAGRDELGCMLV